MRTVRNVLLGFAAGCAVLGAAPAMAADPTPGAHNMELARHLFAGMHMDEMMQGMMKSMAPAMIAQARKNNPNLTDADATALTEAMSESTMGLTDKVIDRVIPLYASTFSEKELQDAVNFYDSPSGQAMLTKMPMLAAKMGPIMSDLMPEVSADLQKRLCAKIDCSKRAQPPAAKS